MTTPLRTLIDVAGSGVGDDVLDHAITLATIRDQVRRVQLPETANRYRRCERL
jgi:hypothetical protein